jgi:hypothetical protein
VSSPASSPSRRERFIAQTTPRFCWASSWNGTSIRSITRPRSSVQIRWRRWFLSRPPSRIVLVRPIASSPPRRCRLRAARRRLDRGARACRCGRSRPASSAPPDARQRGGRARLPLAARTAARPPISPSTTSSPSSTAAPAARSACSAGHATHDGDRKLSPAKESPQRRQQTGPTDSNSVCLSSDASRARRRVGVLWGFGRNSGCRASGDHHTLSL